jgi:hypothetical protein
MASMPTPESAKAFERLSEARNRLVELTKRLNEVHSHKVTDPVRSHEVQAEWNGAFLEFEAAAKDFTSRVQHLRGELER